MKSKRSKEIDWINKISLFQSQRDISKERTTIPFQLFNSNLSSSNQISCQEYGYDYLRQNNSSEPIMIENERKLFIGKISSIISKGFAII